MSESTEKTKMVKLIKARGGYGRRVEDQYAVGTLDTIFIPIGGPTFFAEVKLVKHQSFGPTERQWVEMGRIDACAAPFCFPIMIGVKGGFYYFHEFGPKVIQLNQCFSVTTSDMHFHDQLVAFYNARLK